MTIDGSIVAHYITSGTLDAGIVKTGLLQGGKVTFDLTNGTLFIGDDINNFNFLFDGQNLHIRGDFATYQSDKKAIELEGNNIFFYDWEGTPRYDFIGSIATGRRDANPDMPGISIRHVEDAHTSITYRGGQGSYRSYMDFDNYN